MRFAVAASIAGLLALAGATAAAAEAVRVYRCTDAQGAVALQDAPCADDQAEQVRDLQRPVDAPAPPRPAVPSATAAAPLAPAPVQELVVRHVEPQPLYECVREDGSRYESTSGRPERRWVPLWTLGLDPRAPPTTFGAVGRPRPSPTLSQPRSSLPAPAPDAYAAGTWIEDRCYRLPAAEVCARRRARADALGRRIFNTVRQSEREQLRLEQRGLEEQVRAECG